MSVTILSNPNILSSTHKPIRVFLVEDYQLARLGLKTYFEQTNTIKVIGESENAEDGLLGIKWEKPDLVLMDLTLPGMSGTKATQMIKQFDPQVKVIILTFQRLY